ncbi:hypothetical protein [Sulfitobacter sediminilitoris]|uniref:hypothetical protein n=1 Tax=Sulfitobacter sediminilitoris TaxID=2698830 RepID=UPI00360BC5ED
MSGTDVTVRFENAALAAPIDVLPDPGGNNTVQTVTLPDAPAVWAPGLYQISLAARSAPGAPLYRSNSAAFQLAPIATLPPTSVARVGPDNEVQIDLDFRPNVWPGQRVELILGGQLATAPARTTATGTVTFTFPDIPAGAYPMRLRVDGVESWLVLRELPPSVRVLNHGRQSMTRHKQSWCRHDSARLRYAYGCPAEPARRPAEDRARTGGRTDP